jgi:ParB family chromosome partitioning protein
MQLVQIPMQDIFSDADWNCRGPIIPFDVMTLSESIREKGLLQPIVVQPWTKHPPQRYKIVVGHRRHAAIKLLKWESLPCNVAENLTEEDARTLNLIENLERADLNMLQEAKAIEWFRKRGLQLREVAKKIGKSTGWITVRYCVLDLEPDIQLEIAAGLLKQDQIKALLDIPSRQGRIDAVKRIKDAKLRGESEEIVTAAKQKKSVLDDGTVKAARKMTEMFELQDLIYNQVGANIATRTLAWTGGVISTKDYLKSLEEEYPGFSGDKKNES